MKSTGNRSQLSMGIFDILILLSFAKKNNWKSLREQSIGRIIYLSSVLYGFIYTKEKNIFSDIYEFSFDETGPFCEIIKKSLVHLESLDKIEHKGLAYTIATDIPVPQTDEEARRKEWVETIMDILAVYGESKIYDFVIRDPSYQDSFKRVSKKSIQVDINNVTIKKLNSFKEAFEETLGKKTDKVKPQKYLYLYFEYVFGKVLRGELNG